MNMALKEPEVETPDTDTEDDNDPLTYLITYLDGREAEEVRLDGTEDDGHSKEEIGRRFRDSIDAGRQFLFLGGRFIRVASIRSIGPTDAVALVELEAFETLSDSVEAIVEGYEEIKDALSNTAQAVDRLSQFQGMLHQAQAELFQSIQSEEALYASGAADRDESKAGSTLKPLRLSTGGKAPATTPAPRPAPRPGPKLPPGVRPK